MPAQTTTPEGKNYRFIYYIITNSRIDEKKIYDCLLQIL